MIVIYNTQSSIQSVVDSVLLNSELTKLKVCSTSDNKLVISDKNILENFKYPDVEEAINIVKNEEKILLEIDTPYNEELVLELCKKYPNVKVACEDIELLKKIFLEVKDIKLGLIEKRNNFLYNSELIFILSFCMLNYLNTDIARIESIKKEVSNLDIILYNVNNLSEYNFCKTYDVYGIISDFPRRFFSHYISPQN